jgi:hypothetical protein
MIDGWKKPAGNEGLRDAGKREHTELYLETTQEGILFWLQVLCRAESSPTSRGNGGRGGSGRRGGCVMCDGGRKWKMKGRAKK